MSPFSEKIVSRKQRWKNFLTSGTNSAHKHIQLGSKITELINAWKIYFRWPRSESSNDTRVSHCAQSGENSFAARLFFLEDVVAKWKRQEREMTLRSFSNGDGDGGDDTLVVRNEFIIYIRMSQHCMCSVHLSVWKLARAYNATTAFNSKRRYQNSATAILTVTSPIVIKGVWYPKIWQCPWKIQFLGNTRIKTLEDLSKTFWNDLTEFSSRWVWNLRKALSGIRFFT